MLTHLCSSLPQPCSSGLYISLITVRLAHNHANEAASLFPSVSSARCVPPASFMSCPMPPVASGCRHAILLLLWAVAGHGKTVACLLLTLALVVCLSLQLVLFSIRMRSLLSCTPLIYKRAATARPRYCNIAIHLSAGSRVLACSNRAHRLKLESGFWRVPRCAVFAALWCKATVAGGKAAQHCPG